MMKDVASVGGYNRHKCICMFYVKIILPAKYVLVSTSMYNIMFT